MRQKISLGLVILMILMMFTGLVSFSSNNVNATDYITVLAPSDGDICVPKTVVSIDWSSNVDGFLMIELYSNDVYDRTITNNAENRHYSWAIPSSIPDGSKYQIKISSISDPTVFDIGSYFTISSTGGYIELLSPNGGESWEPSTTHLIIWNSNMDGHVTIELYKNDILWDTITSGTENDGQYSWIIPSQTIEDTEYKIKLSLTTDSSINDISNSYFSISSTGESDDAGTDSDAESGNQDDSEGGSSSYNYIQITSPNGGESWEGGNRYDITWNSDLGGDVYIYLYKNDEFISTISGPIGEPNNGKFSWSIPSFLMTSSSYKIKVHYQEGYSSNWVDDYSDDFFSITSTDTSTPTITVTSPNGGETWKSGETYTIKWETSFEGGYVDILLYKDGKSHRRLESMASNYIGIYHWTIPEDYVETSDDYEIRIRSYSDDSIEDYSDEPFSIKNGNEIPDFTFTTMFVAMVLAFTIISFSRKRKK